MKLAKRDIKILLILLGAIIIIIAFFYGYKPIEESNEVVLNEITGLRSKLQELQVLAAKEDFYRSSTEEMKAEVEKLFDKFPADIKTEDCIMYAQKLETETKADVEGITFTPDTLAYSWGQGKIDANAQGNAAQQDASSNTNAQAAPAETAAQTDTSQNTAQAAGIGGNNKELFVTQITLKYKCTYKELKGLINDIQTYKNRSALQSMEVSYDTETGNLNGSVKFGMYSLTGLDKVYQAPSIPSMTIGTDNIFGTVEVPANTEEKTQETTQN
ncbi:hypothetical protein [Anaerosacchariphilus polymeriproducens]|uniref:Pilus assembly protein PilO n=1 Tax=Anaerosacchariphilus polymeriproducens TaxID=1812858 RepID=A0A371AQK7_9FIRM|nr:hypothetical protein [Anaerosacchariphilus polymeriproducens]RDU21847.1 hypothetical protein DWV06_17850 [Anaerosacchariphilus polymeriproducens]